MADAPLSPAPGRRGDRALPGGTLTFLFTDIVGSTRLLREDRSTYADALIDHRDLLRAAFLAHRGREVDTQGDAFFVAFPSAGQAVAAAADAQRSLAAHPWPAGAHVSVRMGLHTGEATVAGDSYVGLAVHRAARIAALGSGGQVLLSQATAAVVGDDLPDGTALRPLGAHSLKDFPVAAPLFQLDVDSLPAIFPSLSTASRYRPLPLPAGELLGREGDVSALAALLSDDRTRLVTLTGPGGVGKSRLALQTAGEVSDAFPGGVVFVPLSDLADADLVLRRVADAVGTRPEPGVEVTEAVRAMIGNDRTLLVLDNFEQVAAAGAALASLLERTPAAVALVTSRRALRVHAEQKYAVEPLSDEAAARMFAARAAAARPGFVSDARNAPVVAEICRRLDGLPLAIELAAARMRVLTPEALLAGLGERLDRLGGGPVDLPERQRGLRATMDWSFGLLDPHAQAIFRRLSVFSGGWTIPAAEIVCGGPKGPDVLESLFALLDDSLVSASDQPVSEPRLSMLETVRTYALEKLTAGPDRAETERRHTEWVLAMVDPLVHVGARGFRDAMERFDGERANVRAAVQRAVDAADAETAALLIRDVVPYLMLRDAFGEARGWLDQILPRATEAPPVARGRLLILRAVVADVTVEGDAVRALLEEGRQLVPDDTDHRYDRALAALAGLFVAVGDGALDEAARFMGEAMPRFAAVGLELAFAFEAMFRGNVAMLSQDMEGAEQHYRAALEVAGRLGDEGLIGQFLGLLGLVLLIRGDIAAARRSILDSAAANRRAGQPSGVAYSLEALGAVALDEDRPRVAARALAAAVAARQNIGMPVNPALPSLVDELVGRARGQLGDESYEAACAEGRRWPLLEALDRTLEELTAGAP